MYHKNMKSRKHFEIQKFSSPSRILTWAPLVKFIIKLIIGFALQKKPWKSVNKDYARYLINQKLKKELKNNSKYQI